MKDFMFCGHEIESDTAYGSEGQVENFVKQ